MKDIETLSQKLKTALIESLLNHQDIDKSYVSSSINKFNKR